MKPSRRRIAIVGVRGSRFGGTGAANYGIFLRSGTKCAPLGLTREGRSGIQYGANCFRGGDNCTGGRSAEGLCAFYPAHGNGLTAAHRTLPFGTRVRVSDPKTGRAVTVTINDRGPFGNHRVLDLSPSAARALGMISRGVIYVKAEVL